MARGDGDALSQLLDVIRREVGLDDAAIAKIESKVRAEFAGERIYVPSRRKIAAEDVLGLPEDLAPEEKAKRLGVTTRRYYQFVAMMKGGLK